MIDVVNTDTFNIKQDVALFGPPFSSMGVLRCSNLQLISILFCRFPKNQEIRKRWVDALKKSDWVPPPHSVVCSAHFKDDCFQEILGFNVLKSLAVPSILNPPGNTGITGKALPVRPKGILKSKSSPRKENETALKVKTDQYLFSMKPSNQNEVNIGPKTDKISVADISIMYLNKVVNYKTVMNKVNM